MQAQQQAGPRQQVHNWKNVHPGAPHYDQAQYKEETPFAGHARPHTLGASSSTGINKFAILGAVVGLGVLTVGAVMLLKKKRKPSLTVRVYKNDCS
jgi:hypothetical protein